MEPEGLSVTTAIPILNANYVPYQLSPYSKRELGRFCEAVISIHQKIQAIEQEEVDNSDNLLKNAPHTAEMIYANT